MEAMDPPARIEPESFDLVVIGTGLVESLVAGCAPPWPLEGRTPSLMESPTIVRRLPS